MCFISCSKRYNCGKAEPWKKNRRIKGVGVEGEERKQRGYGVRSIQPKFQPIQPGKVVHLKKWTSFFETFLVGMNRSMEFWTEISKTFGSMDRAHILPAPSPIIFCFNVGSAFAVFKLLAWARFRRRSFHEPSLIHWIIKVHEKFVWTPISIWNGSAVLHAQPGREFRLWNDFGTV